jgi:hypothetical protein
VHHEPPEVTWPLPEPDAGAEPGELRPLDDELFEEPDVPVPLDVPELAEVPEPEVDCRVLLAELEDACVAPGRPNATAPAAIRLAAAAETVTARSRARPRSRSRAPGHALCGWVLRGNLLWW